LLMWVSEVSWLVITTIHTSIYEGLRICMWLYWHSNCSLVSSLLLRLGSLVVCSFLLSCYVFGSGTLLFCHLLILFRLNLIMPIYVCAHPCVLGVLPWSVKSQLSHSEDICLRKMENCNLFINNVPQAYFQVWAFRRGEQVVLASKS
jgi:hypothetical protein